MKLPSHGVAERKWGLEDGHTCPRSQAYPRVGAPSVRVLGFVQKSLQEQAVVKWKKIY